MLLASHAELLQVIISYLSKPISASAAVKDSTTNIKSHFMGYLEAKRDVKDKDMMDVRGLAGEATLQLGSSLAKALSSKPWPVVTRLVQFLCYSDILMLAWLPSKTVLVMNIDEVINGRMDNQFIYEFVA